MPGRHRTSLPSRRPCTAYRYRAGPTGAARATGRVGQGKLPDGPYRPAVPGTARTFAGRPIGGLATRCGLVLAAEATPALSVLLLGE